MDMEEAQRINMVLLMKLCRDIGEKEKISVQKAKRCTLVINDAIMKIKEV